nr:MAG: RNA-dependent RNA polymerase [Grapevine umbra-like virus 4]
MLTRRRVGFLAALAGGAFLSYKVWQAVQSTELVREWYRDSGSEITEDSGTLSNSGDLVKTEETSSSDESQEGGSDAEGGKRKRVRWYPRRIACRKVAQHLRATFGLMQDRGSNRQILDREARKFARSLGVRDSDLIRVCPLAVSWALTPSPWDLEAHWYDASWAVTTLRRWCSPGFLEPRVVSVRGVDTNIHYEPPPGVVTGPPRGPEKVAVRRCLVVEAPKPHLQFAIHNPSMVNVMRGLTERVYFRPVDGKLVEPPKPVKMAAKLRPAWRRFAQYCPKTPVLTRDEFIACYAGDRRRTTRYEQARDELGVTPLQERDARLSTFVKCEKIDFTTKGDPAPRVIQPRQPRFLMESGRYIRPIEHVLYKHMGKILYKEDCVAKGFNAVETAALLRRKWEAFPDPVAVGMDASRFDQHVSLDALYWTHSIYQMFNDCPYFAWILSLMRTNKGVALAHDGTARYSVVGRRMSGDMDTALGNCLLMVSMTWCYCKAKGIKHKVLDNGDDLVVILNRPDLERFSQGVVEWFLGLGFVMKVEPAVSVFEQIEFCQTSPVWNGQQYVMCRGVRAISKDLVCTVGTRDIRPWLKAVGDCNLSLCSGIPILQEVALWMRRNGRDSKVAQHAGFASGMQRLARGMEQRAREVGERARFSFYCMTGILPDMQKELEEVYRNLGRVRETGEEISSDEQQYHCESAIWEGCRPDYGT